MNNDKAKKQPTEQSAKQSTKRRQQSEAQSNKWKGVLNNLMNPTPQGAETPQQPQQEGEKFLQPYEQTGAELEATLSPDVREKIQLRRGRPRQKTLIEEGVYVRTSFIMKALYLEKLREISRRENLTMKDILEEALRVAIDAYEDKRGAIALTSGKKGSVEGLFSK